MIREGANKVVMVGIILWLMFACLETHLAGASYIGGILFGFCLLVQAGRDIRQTLKKETPP